MTMNYIWDRVGCPTCGQPPGTRCTDEQLGSLGPESFVIVVHLKRITEDERSAKYRRGQYGKLRELLYAARMRRRSRLAKARG
jgi:hypothetical protein